MSDLFGVRATLESCKGCCLLFELREPSVMQHAKRKHWSRVAMHMRSALRFRQALGEGDLWSLIDAVIDPNAPGGKFLYVNPAAMAAGAREQVRCATSAIERARSSRNRANERHTLDAWSELVDGRWTIVERVDTDNRRFYLALRNPELEPRRTLSRRQIAVVRALLSGETLAAVASSWGRSTAAIYSLLRAAKRSLNLQSREELVAFGSGLMECYEVEVEGVGVLLILPRTDLHQRLEAAGFTAAERSVTNSILVGRSNAEIAARRGCTVSAVEKLSHSMFQKLGVGCRLDFIMSLAVVAANET
ncbi:hypothetical protein DB30_07494 [Enhygromyxa salina]|uniref:HTH luxR-type domain-containing protein n=1 Tax=Enhygromyxa salina TaxID=215803 RepID=A0A0C1Z874_9BACT|nr:hypothetical protein DB30_07494 [Enhygromyxa salina]